MRAHAPANSIISPVNPAAAKAAKRPGRVTTFLVDRYTSWGRWALGILFACFAIVCLLVYLAVQWTTYHTLMWGNGTSNAVTLVRDIGHGGVSEVTVTFSDHILLVTEVDANDPNRVTVMKVNEQIVLPDDGSVLTAALQDVLQPGRLDLVIKLKGGIAYHTEFTTILINNVDAVKKNPQAPGFRAPTAAELNQALQKLNS
ncbi:MAG TPA: hypothetical protein VFU69_08725 [Ktedonobacterales bacterium]|nr:hypothetical protein [Ktedonobacterales bacterium]